MSGETSLGADAFAVEHPASAPPTGRSSDTRRAPSPSAIGRDSGPSPLVCHPEPYPCTDLRAINVSHGRVEREDVGRPP